MCEAWKGEWHVNFGIAPGLATRANTPLRWFSVYAINNSTDVAGTVTWQQISFLGWML